MTDREVMNQRHISDSCACSCDEETAKAWAVRLHEGQLDKAGQPYIDHPRRVAERLNAPEARVVGWLHDTVEDTGLTLEEIAAQFGRGTADAVDHVTRRGGESWDDYIERVRINPLAREVKISDLIDNSNLSRLPRVTLRDVQRQARYNRALMRLMQP